MDLQVCNLLSFGDALKADLIAVSRGLSHVWYLGYRHVACYMDCLKAREVIISNINVHIFWHRDDIIFIWEMVLRDWHVSVVHIPWDQNMHG